MDLKSQLNSQVETNNSDLGEGGTFPSRGRFKRLLGIAATVTPLAVLGGCGEPTTDYLEVGQNVELGIKLEVQQIRSPIGNYDGIDGLTIEFHQFGDFHLTLMREREVIFSDRYEVQAKGDAITISEPFEGFSNINSHRYALLIQTDQDEDGYFETVSIPFGFGIGTATGTRN